MFDLRFMIAVQTSVSSYDSGVDFLDIGYDIPSWFSLAGELSLFLCPTCVLEVVYPLGLIVKVSLR